METLFDLPPSPSPRLLWIARHGVQTFRIDVRTQDNPWTAFIRHDDQEGTGDVHDDYHRHRSMWGDMLSGHGATEDEAIVEMAQKRGIKLWNEV